MSACQSRACRGAPSGLLVAPYSYLFRSRVGYFQGSCEVRKQKSRSDQSFPRSRSCLRCGLCQPCGKNATFKRLVANQPARCRRGTTVRTRAIRACCINECGRWQPRGLASGNPPVPGTRTDRAGGECVLGDELRARPTRGGMGVSCPELGGA